MFKRARIGLAMIISKIFKSKLEVVFWLSVLIVFLFTAFIGINYMNSKIQKERVLSESMSD